MPSSQEYALSISCATGTFLGSWGASGGRHGCPPQPGASLLEEEMGTHQKNYWMTIYKATDSLCCDCGPHSNVSYKCLSFRAVLQRLLDSEESSVWVKQTQRPWWSYTQVQGRDGNHSQAHKGTIWDECSGGKLPSKNTSQEFSHIRLSTHAFIWVPDVCFLLGARHLDFKLAAVRWAPWPHRTAVTWRSE